MSETQQVAKVRLLDAAPTIACFRSEVLEGLRQPIKTLPCKFFYDAEGSQIFDAICELAEYYPTRTELAILQQAMPAIRHWVGPDVRLVEYGSGASRKTRLLLDQLEAPAAYLPIDISREHLLAASQDLAERYPAIEILLICADYTQPLSLPQAQRSVGRTVVFYPGSTIGNFHPDEALSFLTMMRELCLPDGGVLLGVDLKKDPSLLHAAYNDTAGVTAAFNLNLLARINRELDANFALANFRHYACYNPIQGRIEMHLVSLHDQTVWIGDQQIDFRRGEPIWTECSYKYHLQEFAALAAQAQLAVAEVWTDPQNLFSVHYLRPIA